MPPELAKQIDETIKSDVKFKDRSHFFEVLATEYIKSDRGTPRRKP